MCSQQFVFILQWGCPLRVGPIFLLAGLLIGSPFDCFGVCTYGFRFCGLASIGLGPLFLLNFPALVCLSMPSAGGTQVSRETFPGG